MKRVGRFKVTESFQLTGHELVAVGEMEEGYVKPGFYALLEINEKVVTLKITGVEHVNIKNDRHSFIALTFIKQSSVAGISLKAVRLKPQTIDIFGNEKFPPT